MIHVDFANFDEMVAFARRLIGTTNLPQTAAPSGQANSSAPTASTAPTRAQSPASAHAGAPAASQAPVTAHTAQPVTPPVPAAPAAPPTVPTSAKTYTRDELAMAAIPIMDAGGQQALMDLLHTFGVNALTELPEAHYGAFATALRGMGAKI